MTYTLYHKGKRMGTGSLHYCLQLVALWLLLWNREPTVKQAMLAGFHITNGSTLVC